MYRVIIINDIEVIHTNITEVIGNPIDWIVYQNNVIKICY